MKINDKKYWKEEDFEVFRSFPVSSFRGTKNLGPWDGLQKKLVEEFGLEKAKDIYGRLYLRREEYEKMERYVRKWVDKYHPDMSKKGKEMAIGMYTLQYAPCSFYQNPEWTKKGVFYLKRKGIK